ncbi:FAD-dependent oxidoreductase [Listeria kieliensis]
MKIVIVGGVAGGMSAATRLRRLNEEAEIVVLEKGPYVSFANCGLPYYISGEISEREDLLVQTPESLRARFRIDVKPFHEVLEIKPDEKQVVVQNQAETFEMSYDKLILSPGAKPITPPIPGLNDTKNLFTVRSVPDVDAIERFIQEKIPQKAVVIGAGFIGMEMAESLARRGMQVTIVEKAPHVLPPLDVEMAVRVEQELTKNNINLRLGKGATAFRDKGRQIELEDGEVLISDLTIFSIGVAPETSLAQAAQIKTGLRGGIIVDENYETSAKDVYAIGDAIVVKQEVSQQDALISLASPANRQGRMLADIIFGKARPNKGFLGTAIVRVFDLAAAATGLNEKALQEAEIPYTAVHIQGKSHASYFPGNTPLLLKVLFEKESGRILGAQAVGENGVDKRIDILATAIKAGMTICDLPELEFTYAPPFGSAKDPVNMAGYAGLNLLEGLSENIQWHELEAERAKGAVLLDVRSQAEIEKGKIKGSIHIPLDELRTRVSELEKDVPIVVTCQVGLRGYLAERILKNAGYQAKNLDGGFSLYQTILPEEVE